MNATAAPSPKMEAQDAAPNAHIALRQWEPDAPYARRLRDARDDQRYAVYLDERPNYLASTAFYIDAADVFFAKGQTELALRVLSNLAEMDLENRHVLRVLGHRLMQARFGRVIEAIRENEARMEAIGFATYRYKLVCFVIAGALCGLAGALLANQNSFVSPKLIEWTQSGTLMVMVILGGVGYHYGGAIGALVMLVLEEVISSYTIYWQLPVGLIKFAVVNHWEGAGQYLSEVRILTPDRAQAIAVSQPASFAVPEDGYADNVTVFINTNFQQAGDYIVQTLVNSSLFAERVLPVILAGDQQPVTRSEQVN